ncbi:FHA domain protein [Minicystis rosea]|nr:FHA domain protein [Minicystis rosea]
MAILERRGTRVRCHLLSRHMVGRSSLAHLRLADPSVSAEHAIVSWNGREWEVYDLGSRNGTTVDGRRLSQGERAPMPRGAFVGFGSASNTWHLVDDGPPAVIARPADGSDAVVGEHDLLALPSADDPAVTIYRDAAGEWVLDRDGALERVSSGREVTAGDRRFTLHLPDVLAPTLEAAEAPLSLDCITLSFRVSRDEEYVELAAHAGARAVDLGARAHHALLLTLARARLRDDGIDLPESSRGWVYQEDLAKGLGQDEGHLNVTLFRCRQHLAAAGIAGAAGIVERRKPARQLRIGVGRIEIAMV